MADHLRKQIRVALVTRVTALSTTGTRVADNREHVFDDATLPGLRVYAVSDGVLSESMSGARQARQVTFIVEAVAKANADMENTLDQIAKEVEIAIAADPTLGNLCRGGCRYDGIDDFRFDDTLDKPCGVWPMRYVADYDVSVADPSVAV